MAGRKTFTAGEILTSADVNSFLMDQTVMVFDDSAARGSAIPTPSEGMTTYLKSDDAVEFFDGSQFRRVGGLVDVQSVLKTDTFTASSIAAEGNVAVTGLSITHTLSNASNKLLIMAHFGVAGTTGQTGAVGIAVADDGTLIGIGTSVGSRTAVAAGAESSSGTGNRVATNPHINLVYAPGDTASHTYTLRAINISSISRNLFINRTEADNDSAGLPRGVSSLTIQEVAV